MNQNINVVLTKICDYDILHIIVGKRMSDINFIKAIKIDSESEFICFILCSVAKYLKEEIIFDSVLASVIELSLPNNTISRAELDDMYCDVWSKMTEHDFDKIALEHYDCKENWVNDNLKADAIFKCVILQFRNEMIANAVVHFNAGNDSELLELLRYNSGYSKILKAITIRSNEFAAKYNEKWC